MNTRTEQRTAPPTEQRDGPATAADVDPARQEVALPASVDTEWEARLSDRVRWAAVWAGLLVALSTFLLLQLVLVAVDVVNLGSYATADGVATAVVAFIAFALGGLTTGASAKWRGVDDGLLNGVVLWALGLVLILVFSGLGSGVALGTFDPADVFEEVTVAEVEETLAGESAREAAGWALLGLSLALVAAAGGAALGSKLWPPRREIWLDEPLGLTRREQDRSATAPDSRTVSSDPAVGRTTGSEPGTGGPGTSRQ